MTGHVTRLYVSAIAIVVFFLLWALVAAHPWTEAAASTPDPRAAGLNAREQRLRAKATRVKQVVDHRWAIYERRLGRRRSAIAAAEQRHLRELEAAYAAAVRAAQVANARAAEARAYAANVLAWAQVQAATAGTAAVPATRRAPVAGALPGEAGSPTAPSGNAGRPVTATVPAPAPSAAATAPPPAPAPPPVVQVITQPPVTKTTSSK